jgi:hypothetical protein
MIKAKIDNLKLFWNALCKYATGLCFLISIVALVLSLGKDSGAQGAKIDNVQQQLTGKADKSVVDAIFHFMDKEDKKIDQINDKVDTINMRLAKHIMKK